MKAEIFQEMNYIGQHGKERTEAGNIHKTEGELDIRKMENGRSGWRGN